MGKARTMSRSRGHSGASADSHGGSRRGPSLTASERAYMIRKAKEASVALVDHAHTLDGPVQWHYTGKFRGIQMYRGEGSYDRVGTTGTEFLCGVTTMMGSIEEVASYFDQQTTERMLVRKADDVLDCGVLYSLVQGDPNNPFYRVSAKYQLYEGPSAFSRERDYCFLECQNTFRHASGRRGWVLSMHSIKLPNCPELDGVVRGSMYQSGYVFVEAEKEGYMDVMHSLQINFKSTSRLPHFLLNSALKRRILSVVTISREIQTSRMGRQTLLKKKDLMPKRARALCVNCSRKFSLFVRKTRCRVCGEVVCQPCAPQVMISTKRGPVKTRVCTKCYHLSPGDEYEPIGGLPNSQNGGDPRRMQNETRYSDILQDNPDVYHEADEDSMDEDEDEDGLEEQSDYSVFAQSRFTEASRDSVATSNFGASSLFESHFEGSSQFDATSELDDSQYYDGGASESSFVSGTTTSHWQGGNSTASSMMGWNQASSVKPAAGYIYDPQASMMSSGLYGTSKYGESEYGASNYTVDEEPDNEGVGTKRRHLFRKQADKSFGDRSRRTDASSDFGGSRFLSTRSNGTFAKSNVRVSVAPSAQSEDLMFNSQRSGLMASKGSNASYRGRRLDASQASSKSSSSSFGSRGLNASQASSIRTSKHPDDLAFDASQLSVDKSKFSSSIAILETSADSAEHVVMMERLSSQRGSNASTLFDEDLLAQSSAGMNEHINSMRTRAAYQLPDEEDRVSDELLKREQEHRSVWKN
ncbi:1-phosphatidylinositol 3-phosphate 5-kinase [Phytophthora ramorum]|uniref:1-phosphatidylinositol 3-phosphate 5-kinase n=1 Tax=Phytophthora ramorum TaxID=164328 RepID=UPI003099E648|nr:1-phosphatidylinositol 3-phosphate 5-kinase [Phytophthora ramorum]